jgi:hypothetical protein
MAPQQLPEEMGIGQLPAGEMNFAGGGIVAFADGGDVERYSGEFGSLTGASLDAARARAQAAQQRLYTYGLRQRQQDPLGFQTAQQELTAAQAALQNAEQGYGAEMAASGVNRAAFGGPSAPTLPAPTAPAAAAPAENLSGMDRRLMAGSQPSIASFQTPLPLKGKAEDKGKGKGQDKTDRIGPAATGPAEDKSVSGLDALVKDFTRSTELAQGELRNQRVGLASQLEQEALGTKEEGEKRRKERGDVFAGREARLAAREGELTGMKDKHLGLALLQAGAAMMTTPGNLGMALGKGVQVGSERYIAGIDKINAAKDKFAEARDRLDELRLNRDDMNEKEIREENRAIRNARLQGQQLFLDGATNDLKISNDNQKAIFGVAAESILTDKRIQGQKDVAKITTAPALERNRLSQNDANKVRTEYGRLQAKVMDTLSKDENYKMATPAKQQVLYTNALRQAISTNPFLASYAGGIGFSAAPSGTGKVYDLTGE